MKELLHKKQKFIYIFKEGRNLIILTCAEVLPRKKNHFRFVNISPQVVNNTWMERSLKVLTPVYLNLGWSWSACSFFNIGRTGVNNVSIYSMEIQKFSSFKRSQLLFKLYFVLCWYAYYFLNKDLQHEPERLQSVNIYILCVFISMSPLLSRNFLASHVAVYLLLIACQQNW